MSWNSCRHRSCPKCSWPAKFKWLSKTRHRLLGTPHHHFVFTIASELHGLWIANTTEMTRLLFRCSEETLMLLFAQRYRGAMPGVIAVLHTWGRSLALHPHLHMIVTRGGVDPSGRWQAPPRNHKAVLPARVVSKLFRGKLLDAIRRGLAAGRLVLPKDTDADAMRHLIATACEKKWSIFIGHAGTRSQTIVDYLGRYVSGGPIGNGRILDMRGGTVVILHRDYRNVDANGRPAERPMEFSKEEFLRRWMLHIPLPNSKNVRSYGLYAAAYRGPEPRPPRSHHLGETADEDEMRHVDGMRCPDCGAPLRLTSVTRIEWKRAPPLGQLA